jgi:hypothetical protein
MNKEQTDAGTGFFSAIDSTYANIEAKGGEQKAIDVNKTLGRLKGKKEALEVAADKVAGILDSNGNITAKGDKALAIEPGMQASALIGKEKLGENTANIIKQWHDQVYKQAKNDGKSEAEANALAEKAVAPYKGKSGQAFWDELASKKAGSFTSSNSVVLGDGIGFSGYVGGNGEVSGKVSMGLSSSDDSSTSTNTSSTYKSGKHITTGGEVNAAIIAYKAAHHGKAPTTGQLINFVKDSQLAEAAKNHIFGDLAAVIADKSGMSPHHVEEALFGSGAALGAHGLNSILGKPVNKVWRGLKRGFDKTSEKLTDSFVFGDRPSNPTNNPGNSTTDTGNNNSTNQNDNTSKNPREHSDSFKSDNSIISKNGGGSKPTSIVDQHGNPVSSSMWETVEKDAGSVWSKVGGYASKGFDVLGRFASGAMAVNYGVDAVKQYNAGNKSMIFSLKFSS